MKTKKVKYPRYFVQTGEPRTYFFYQIVKEPGGLAYQFSSKEKNFNGGSWFNEEWCEDGTLIEVTEQELALMIEIND